MRVAMYYNNHDVRVEEMPKPQIAPGELLVKMKASGICGSDVMEWYRIKKAPLVLGHEATGEIVEAGSAVQGYNIGNRVFVSHHVPCNKCYYCLSGNHTACQTLHTTNYYPGGFSEYIRVPEINVGCGVFLLPQEVSYEDGTFIEPLACVERAQESAGLKAGMSVLILGSGISGLLHLLLARANSAGRVFSTDMNQYRLRRAKEFGADMAIRADADLPEVLRKANQGRLADLVIVATSAHSAFSQSLQAVERGGVILFFAPPDPVWNIPVPVNDFWRQGIKIIHSYGASPVNLSLALELIRAKKVAVSKMITHRFKLSEAGFGFKTMVDSKESIKVIIEPD